MHGGDAVIHFDPCEASQCASCKMRDCHVREAPFEASTPFTTDRLTRTDDQLGAEDESTLARGGPETHSKP